MDRLAGNLHLHLAIGHHESRPERVTGRETEAYAAQSQPARRLAAVGTGHVRPVRAIGKTDGPSPYL